MVLVSFFMPKMPSDASVPRMVATTEATAATKSVLQSEDRMVSLENSFLYQSSVKPVQTVRLFEALKELKISTKIGIYRKAKTRTV